MNHRSHDLPIVVALAAVAVAAALLPAPAVARAAFALPLVLVLPGYALTAAAFRGRALGLAEWVAFSGGLSLAVAALGGFALTWSPAGLQAGSWATLLGGITLAGSAAAWRRRRREAPPIAPRRVAPGLGQGLLLGLAGLIAAGALGLAATGAAQQETAGFSQLWLLAADRAAAPAVRVGLQSGEPAATRYHLVVIAEGEVLGDWPALDLAPGERWETAVALSAERADAVTVEALLYRLDEPARVYRRAQLWRDR